MPLFPGQERSEPVLIFIRRHWFALAYRLIVPVVLALLPSAVGLGAQYSGATFFVEAAGFGYTLYALGVHLFWLLAIVLALAAFVDYYLDYWVVTDRRIVSVEQSGLFSRTVAQLHLSRVQDATARVHGPVATVLDYGDVFIQTAGEEARFVFTSIPHPNQVIARIMTLHQSTSVTIDSPKPKSATEPKTPPPPAVTP